MKYSTAALLLLLAPAAVMAGDDMMESICTSENNVFTAHVNLYASELGYYTFEECGNTTNPTIGMEIGQTYTFVQADRSNYYHPMGFAYFPDGAHDGVDELEPGIAQGTDAGCADSMSCPAPMYFLNGDYLGTYSNIPDVLPPSAGEDNFGLDDYEPLFFLPMLDWTDLGTFSIQLNFDDASFSNDIFYFCHIHQFMSGRIKLLSDGVPVQPEEVPPLGYDYEVPGAFDETCGTYGLDDFQLPQPECPERFVCDASEEAQPFADCIDAMNCHMIAGMTTQDSTQSMRALFLHQMIPHHQNAVNMAKALMNTGDLDCPDLMDEDNPNCALEVITREIINNQNFQIQAMRGLLENGNWPGTDDCAVPITSENVTDAPMMASSEDATPAMVSSEDVAMAASSEDAAEVAASDSSDAAAAATTEEESSSNDRTNSGTVQTLMALSFVLATMGLL